MFIIRKIAKTLRGQAKPYQIISAAVLGSLIGFAPPIGQAPLYIIGVILLLAILNANLFIATFTAMICKLLALALTPISFELGLMLIDGPLQPLFKLLANGPVTAWMGFEYYITAGGTVLGTFIGVALGVGYIKLISSFRKKMAKLEADSEKYADWMSKRTVRIVMWVLFGGKAKQTYTELADQKKIGNPVRPLGVVFAVLVVGLLIILQQFASGPIVTNLLKAQLEQFHGATVDIDGIELDLAAGSLTVNRLAMADPDNLDTDLIRANQLSAKLSTSDLLSKRFTIDYIIIDDAVQGAKRDKPGVLIGKRPKPPEKPEEGKSIEDYFDKAKVWKDRLDTFRDWMRKVQGPPKEEDAKQDPSVKDRLREWARLYGYDKVKAAHLIEGSPSVLVKDAKINKLRATWPNEETLDIHMTNFSTNPGLVKQSPRITVKSSGSTFDLDTTIAPNARPDEASKLLLTLRNQSIDETLDGFELPSSVTLKGGTWQTGINGSWSDLDGLDLPMTLVLQDTNFVMGGSQAPVEQFPVAIGIVGSLDNPGLTVDTDALLASMKDVGGQLVTSYLKNAGTEKIKEVIGDRLGDGLGDGLGSAVEGILGGNKDKDKDKDKEDDSNTGDLGDKVREGLGGFLKRDKKDD